MLQTSKTTSNEPNVRLKTVDTNSSKILKTNARRIQAIIQNNSTVACLILLGSGTVSTTNYHFSLAPASANRDGKGGSLVVDNYVGEISAITESGSTILSVVELI